MASTSSFPSLVSHRTPVIIVLAGSIAALGPHWRDCISSCTDPLVKRLSEENYSHPLARMELVVYSQVHPASIGPVYSVVGHDEEGNIVTDHVIMEDTPDNAAFWGYMSVIKIIDDLQTRHPNEEFSFFLWHVIAGQHGFWDHKWETVCGELRKRDVNVSMVLLDDCPIFVQLFSAVSPASSRITPWFHTFSDHRFLLSGFMPLGELAVPSLVSTAHPAPSTSVPSTAGVTAWNSPSELLAHGTQYPDGQWEAPPFSQHAGSDVHEPVPAIVPFLNAYGGPQASNSAAVQSQLPLNLHNMSVPAPMDCPAPPHSSEVGQQQPTPHIYAEKIDSRDDLANANARPMSSGSSDEMNDNEWIGTLNLNGTRVPVRALMAEAVGDPKLSALPNDLEVEPAVASGLKLSTLAIQVWIRKNKTPMVRLSYVDGTDNRDFDQLVEEIRAHGYAVVTWKKRDRLLLAPLGKALLCAAFPEKGTPKRPTPQVPRKVRTVTRKVNPQKKESPQKKKQQKSRQRPGPYLATTSKSSNGPCDGLYPEATARSKKTLQRPQPEQPQMPYYPQVATEPLEGEIKPFSQWNQMDGFTQRQMIPESPPQFYVERHAYPQAQSGWGVLGTHGEQLVDRQMGTVAAGCMTDLSNLKSEAMDGWGVLGAHGELVDRQMGTVAAGCMTEASDLKSETMDASEMFKYVNLDGCGV